MKTILKTFLVTTLIISATRSFSFCESSKTVKSDQVRSILFDENISFSHEDQKLIYNGDKLKKYCKHAQAWKMVLDKDKCKDAASASTLCQLALINGEYARKSMVSFIFDLTKKKMGKDAPLENVIEEFLKAKPLDSGYEFHTEEYGPSATTY